MLRIFLSRPSDVLSCSSRHAYSAQVFPVPTFRRLQLHCETQGTVLFFFLGWQIPNVITGLSAGLVRIRRITGAKERFSAQLPLCLIGSKYEFSIFYTSGSTHSLWVFGYTPKRINCLRVSTGGPFGHGITPSALPLCYSSILGHRNCQIETAVCNWASFFTVLRRAASGCLFHPPLSTHSTPEFIRNFPKNTFFFPFLTSAYTTAFFSRLKSQNPTLACLKNEGKRCF